MKQYFLDTNFISSLLIQKDSLHEEALSIFEEIKNDELYTSVIVIGELFALKEEIDILGFINDLQIRIIEYKKEDIILLSELKNHIRTKLKANDYSILIHSLSYSLELITFDVSLSKIFNTLKSQMI